MSSKNEFKVGVREGTGTPVYLWTVQILDVAYRQAMKFLSEGEYQHLAHQVKLLATEVTPSHSELCSVDAIEDFFELRDRGGLLGGKNVRVFFGLVTEGETKEIVILGAIVKQNNGPTPQGDKITMRGRWRRYRSGGFGKSDSSSRNQP